MTPADTRGQAREQAICEAALELLVEVGYERLTIDAVAARARASKATIYRRWPGKAELVTEAMRCRAAPSILPADAGSLRADLLALLSAAPLPSGKQDALILASILRAGHEAPDLRDCALQQIVEDKRAVIDAVLDRARHRGETVREDAADLVHEILPALVFFRFAVEGRPLDGAFAEHVVDDIVLPLISSSR
ncbi:MAG: TetR/AcrR family transcriptional regulator [Kineosporiaceae bacterium]